MKERDAPVISTALGRFLGAIRYAIGGRPQRAAVLPDTVDQGRASPTSTCGGEYVGNTYREERPCFGAASLRLEGAVSLTVRSGAPVRMTIIGESPDDTARVSTRIENGELTIDTEPTTLSSATVTVGRDGTRVFQDAVVIESMTVHFGDDMTVTSTTLRGIQSSGSARLPRVELTLPTIPRLRAADACEVYVAAVEQPAVDIQLAGAARATIHGRAISLHARLSGAASLTADGLVTDAADIEARGASTARVTSRESVNAQAGGAAAVTVFGQPTTRHDRTSGAGRVEYR